MATLLTPTQLFQQILWLSPSKAVGVTMAASGSDNIYTLYLTTDTGATWSSLGASAITVPYSGMELGNGDITSDSSGNIYMVAHDASSGYIVIIKWTKGSGDTWTGSYSNGPGTATLLSELEVIVDAGGKIHISIQYPSGYGNNGYVMVGNASNIASGWNAHYPGYPYSTNGGQFITSTIGLLNGIAYYFYAYWDASSDNFALRRSNWNGSGYSSAITDNTFFVDVNDVTKQWRMRAAELPSNQLMIVGVGKKRHSNGTIVADNEIWYTVFNGTTFNGKHTIISLTGNTSETVLWGPVLSYDGTSVIVGYAKGNTSNNNVIIASQRFVDGAFESEITYATTQNYKASSYGDAFDYDARPLPEGPNSAKVYGSGYIQYIERYNTSGFDQKIQLLDNRYGLPGSFSGTMLMSGGVVRGMVEAFRYIIGQFNMSGFLNPTLDSVAKTVGNKTYIYKIYDPATGDILGQWNDVVSDFGYSIEINSAGAAIDVTLARNSDSLSANYDVLADDTSDPFETDDGNQIAAETATTNAIGPGTTVDLNLDVKVYEFSGSDADLTGNLVFSGYISKYTTQYGSTEQTIVSIFSYGAELDNWVLEDDDEKTRVPYLSMDPSDILKDAIDRFNLAGGIPSYDVSTIDTTGTTVSYTFNLNTALEVLKKCLELAPTDWFFYLDLATSKIYFKQRPEIPDHYFILGKHILSLNLEKYIEDITNLAYFTGGQIDEDIDGNPINLFKKYERPTSISNYRRGLLRMQDNRVTLESSADVIIESTLDRDENPQFRSSITISNQVYPVRTIKLGDLIGFRNFNNFVDTVTMQVVRIDYTPDAVKLQLDTLLPSVPKRLEDIKRNLNQSDVSNNPDAPTT